MLGGAYEKKNFEETGVKREECVQVQMSKWQIYYFGYISSTYNKKTKIQWLKENGIFFLN